MIVNVNGMDIFYEKTGEGSPVVLLHGNGEDHGIFDVLSDELSIDHAVYAMDSRGHGRSGKARELSYESMMEDTARLIRHLGLNRPFVYGFSDGGIIALLLASRYPDLVRGIAASGANLDPQGVRAKYIRILRVIHFFTRSRKVRMMLTQPDISDEELERIDVPTLIIAGSQDIIREEHTRHIAGCIRNSELVILEGEGHASYVVHSRKLYGILKPFLDRIEG
ncbi:alpha/beta fold hydrolase [Youngiibacter fragilis]|uniref:Alpha/beta hydrolase n=1 Tax=Youngiibacter fragilis 232.1 TaxID=994573 RepID=V7I062_9CLOT|nr:alpha/beta hydrolase [Youngiibacter fragilis]ETA79278.1 alpha/beta hydrolase [Youngiibacter fragilis 232.1]